ncbi:hypothetical protein PRIPAC_70806 [Pristionchus pacificus]|uniref:Uncharacterized protein n=1 Tax=Pristionchus pacificus TaxID=54126 RepID=A0A2A6D0G3_PRIPA|nr:hypothetical protein PRIPAC_70806 [Pristionchus pacificus]|eukprot:PDM83860.1 hypothetical protein PRIPAC_30347 [Pristionchus pacificus]
MTTCWKHVFISLNPFVLVMSGLRERRFSSRFSAGANIPLHSSTRQESSDVGSEELVERTPRAKTPPRPSRLNDEELMALAKSGGLLNIDKAFDLFGAGSVYFRRIILVYSLLFLLVDCSWQLVVDMDRKIDVRIFSTSLSVEANKRSLSPLCESYCGCTDLHEKTITPLFNRKTLGDAMQWGIFYLGGTTLACLTLIATESLGRKKPLLISILFTAVEMFSTIILKYEKISLKIVVLVFGITSTITNVCLFVNALESLPYKLRLPFAIFFFSARRVSHGIISSLALLTDDNFTSLIVCTVFLVLAAIVTYLFIDETAAHLLLQEKMYELELLFDKIGRNADLLPSRNSQQIADELGFREEDVDMKTKKYLKKIFKSKAVLYIVNVAVLVSVVTACIPIVSKRNHLMGIDSTFTSFAISLATIPILIPLVLYSNSNRFQSLTSIELGAGISMFALWCFTEGEVTVCSDSTVYAGVWWWAELGLLIVCEAFSMAVYIVGSVAMVEVVPTRARTFTVALLYTVSAACAAVTNYFITNNKVSRFTLEMPIAASLYLFFALLSTLSYSAPERMVRFRFAIVPYASAIRTYLFLIDQSILFFHVDYLVDIIPKQKSVPRMRKAPKKKKTQAELNSPQLPSNRTEPTNLMEESAPSKTKEDTIDDEKKL